MGEAEQVPELELLHDVKTCRDSTYAMINCLCALRLAVNYFLALPNQKELKDYVLSTPQWLVLEDFEHILQVPHKVQQRMSNESPPRLGSTVPCFELFMSVWEMLGATHPRMKPWMDVGLYDGPIAQKTNTHTHTQE
ncbi:hypothetical protein BDN67DRAFT_911480 [Paxillus ammoniavirescens]|nr:hypothetical protein BDN67DRAFT_911480 [Paxillus ammoniavirescens]